MAIASGGTVSDIPYRYRLVWDFFKCGGDYQVWQKFCKDLGILFSQYENVSWGYISFQFTLRFTDLDWIAIDMLKPPEDQIHRSANEYWQHGSMAFDRIRLSQDEFKKMIIRDIA